MVKEIRYFVQLMIGELRVNKHERGEEIMNYLEEKIKWKISVPIFKQSLILKQLGVAVGIPFGILISTLLLLSGNNSYTLYALTWIGILFFLTGIFILIVYGGRYEVEFILDHKGISSKTQPCQEEKNKLINALTVSLGILSGKPVVAGAGFLAQARQQIFLPWTRITTANYNPQGRTILIKCGLLESVALFCTEDNYSEVVEFVAKSIGI